MRVVFMGTPDFAAHALRAVVKAGHQVVAAYSQPPRPAGRGQQPRPSPVQQTAEALSIPVFCPTSLKSAEEQAAFAALEADIAVVAAYGMLLPPPILQAPRLGCINIHASLLPRWRGAAPIQRAIMSGDAESGVTIMQMEAGLDTGPMLLVERSPITPTTTAAELHDALMEIGGDLVVTALQRLGAGDLPATEQPSDGITYASKISKAEAHIDWSFPAETVARQINGLSPFPGAWSDVRGERLKIVLAEACPDQSGPAGQALTDSGLIGCGSGAVQLRKVQRPGKSALTLDALLRGFPLPVGTVFG